ncbi:MAG: PepSY-associated TM helix domain-containing protein [Vicinamibacterales bacterium]
MYRFLRNVHLAAGLFTAVFLFAYALSAAQMAYPLYRPVPVVTESDLTVPANIDPTPRALASWLGATPDFRGDLRDVEADEDGFALTIARVGTMHRVEYDPAERRVHITSRRQNAVGMLNRIHHVAGVGHAYWAVNAWGWLLASSSLLLLIVALSGVVMWFNRHRERRIGALVLAGGLAWGLTLLVLLRLA